MQLKGNIIIPVGKGWRVGGGVGARETEREREGERGGGGMGGRAQRK